MKKTKGHQLARMGKSVKIIKNESDAKRAMGSSWLEKAGSRI